MRSLLTAFSTSISSSFSLSASSSSSVASFSQFTKKFFCVALVLTTSSPSSSYSSFAFPVVRLARMNSSTLNSSNGSSTQLEIDPDYPGTAVQRLKAVHERIRSFTPEQLNTDWTEVRRSLLWAGGLRDIIDAPPGYGFTGHAFNDFNHCDLTTMLEHVSYNENEGAVEGIHFSNQLGPGVKIASLPELGPGGSWSTCIIGNNKNPPQDVAHLQFRSRVAFKLVWVPPHFTTFILVDDNGDLLAMGNPTGRIPALSERQMNYRTVVGGKYAREADKLAAVLESREL